MKKKFNLNGIYTTRFRTRLGETAATMYFINNKIYGGDCTTAYFGSYEIEDFLFIATLSIKQHNYGLSIFGELKDLKIKIPIIDNCNIKGIVPIYSLVEYLSIHFFKIAELQEK